MVSNIVFLLLSYWMCEGVGYNWKDANTFGREWDHLCLCVCIVYASTVFLATEIIVLSWIFGFDTHFTFTLFSWEFALGIYLFVRTFFMYDAFRDIRLSTRWFARSVRSDYFADLVRQLGWTFTDLPKFLAYPLWYTRTEVLEVANEEVEDIPSFEKGLKDAEELADGVGMTFLFIYRQLFRIVCSGFLFSCTIARAIANEKSSRIEEYMKHREEEGRYSL